VSLDHAQPAHGEHGIEQTVADDILLQNFQTFHGTDDRSVLTAAALDLDGQDAVHDVNEPAIARFVANPSGLHPESSHDNAAAFSAHDVFRAENDLDSKLAADFHPQHDDGFPIVAREQVERTVTYNPVSSSALSNLTPDHPTSQHASTAPTPTAAIEHSDTTVAPDNHVTSQSNAIQAPVNVSTAPITAIAQSDTTIAPDNHVTSQSAAIQAPVSDLQPKVTSTGEPTAQVQVVSSEPTAQVNQVTSTGGPTAQVNQVTLSGEPTAQVNCAALPGDETTAQHDLEASMSDGSTLSIVGIDVHHTATALA
jgi:hypothetical protein